MTRHLTTLSLLAALLMQTGCTVVSHNRAFPKLDWYWSKDAQQQRQEIKQEKLLTLQPVATSPARVQLSAVVVANPAPILNLKSSTLVEWQDSNDLIIWHPIATSSNLTVTCTDPVWFVRGRCARVDVPLTWDASPNATGYKIYWGAVSHGYAASVAVGNVTNAPVTVLMPSPVVYFAVTAVDTNGGESDFSNEIQVVTVKPVLTITRN